MTYISERCMNWLKGERNTRHWSVLGPLILINSQFLLDLMSSPQHWSHSVSSS